MVIWLELCCLVVATGPASSGLPMSFKRARAELEAGGSFTVPDRAVPEDTEAISQAGKKYRAFLLEKYSSGSLTAADTCILAHLHGEAGGVGAEDLGLHPSQASKHASNHLRCRSCSFSATFGPPVL